MQFYELHNWKKGDCTLYSGHSIACPKLDYTANKNADNTTTLWKWVCVFKKLNAFKVFLLRGLPLLTRVKGQEIFVGQKPVKTTFVGIFFCRRGTRLWRTPWRSWCWPPAERPPSPQPTLSWRPSRRTSLSNRNTGIMLWNFFYGRWFLLLNKRITSCDFRPSISIFKRFWMGSELFLTNVECFTTSPNQRYGLIGINDTAESVTSQLTL